VGDVNEKLLKDVVVPGEVIGVIEEFLAGEGTYVDGDKIRSLRIGRAILDVDERKVYVKPMIREELIPGRGDVVIGDVHSLKKDVALVLIRKMENKGVIFNVPFHGILHVSQVSNRFTESILSAVRVMDIIRARIINNKPPFQLSIKEKDLGVLLAFCPQCHNAMVIKDRKLYCPACKIREERKISTKYSVNFKL